MHFSYHMWSIALPSMVPAAGGAKGLAQVGVYQAGYVFRSVGMFVRLCIRSLKKL